MNQIEKNTVKAENQLSKNQFITFINPEGKGKRVLSKLKTPFTVIFGLYNHYNGKGLKSPYARLFFLFNRKAECV